MLKLNGRMRENEISWGMILNGFQSQVPIKIWRYSFEKSGNNIFCCVS
jgi:hypothetical protein